MRGASLLRSNALTIPLADETVDAVISSPPYFSLRSYQDEGGHYAGQIGSEPTPKAFLEALWAVTEECKRVLKPSGSIWINLGDKYAGSGGHNNSNIAKTNGHDGATRRTAPDRYNQNSDGIRAKSLMGLPWRYAIGCIDQLDLILRAEVIWSKPNGLPESVTDRPRRSHEQWFMFTKEPRYYSAIDEIREPSQIVFDAPQNGTDHHARAMKDGGGHHRYDERTNNPLGKLPGSVWEIPSEPLKVPDWLGVDHFAAFPQEWPRRIILGWTPGGICQVCGEGRRPVVDKTLAQTSATTGRTKVSDLGEFENDRGWNGEGYPIGTTTATITGYSCACPTPNAPTRPAVVLDPFAGTGTTVMVARALGRYGIGLDLSADYLRLARWRVFQSGHASKSIERRNREAQGTLL